MILDTNALSALAVRDATILRVVAGAERLALSFVTVAEFEYGLLGSARPDAGRVLLHQLATTLLVLFPDPDTLGYYAVLADGLKRKGRIIPHNDLWTAAIARQHALAILSRDRHFDYVDGVRRVEW